MKKLWMLALVLSACGGDSDDAAPSAPVAAQQVAAPAEGELPGSIYKKALEVAQKEIDADNASERLTELERQIDLERQALD